MINFIDESVSLTSDSFFKTTHVKIINNKNQKIMLFVQTNIYILYRSYALHITIIIIQLYYIYN